MKKSMKRLIISMLAILLCLCVYVPESQAATTSAVQVPYKTGTKITISKKDIAVGSKATIRAKMKADDKNYKSRKFVKISFKNLTPKIASVKKNSKGTAGIVRGKTSGTAKIKVTVTYRCLEKCYTKCVNKKPKVTWVKRTLKESRTITFKVHKKTVPVTPQKPSPIIPDPIHPEPIPVVGGSVTLYFEVDGQAYGKPISVGVGIAPIVDYADKFPAAPEKAGYIFEGWYTKDDQKIGTTAGEIYPAFDILQSGQVATVHAVWNKLGETTI